MQLGFLFILTTIIHIVNTSAYAARLAGVRTQRPALAHSLFNVIALISRGANAIAGPLLASLTDVAVDHQDTSTLLHTYHVVLLAASIGTLISGFLIPSLSRILARGVTSYEQRRSLPRVVVRVASVRGLWRLRQDLKRPAISSVQKSRRRPFPRRFLLVSVLVTAIYTVTNFAAMYASALVPEGARTATSLSPLVTGSGVLLSLLFIDPVAAFVVDGALRKQRAVEDVTYITIWQVGARLGGTLMAQALLWPAGQGLAIITRWLVY
jgi:hypothetical protein